MGMIRLAKTTGNIFVEKIVNRHLKHLKYVSSREFLSVNLATSWNRQCGIATYSEFLAGELKKVAKVYVIDLLSKNALNPYFKILGRSVGSTHDLVHVQFEYGIFSNLTLGRRTLTAFAALPFYIGLAMGNRPIVTTIHEPRKKVSANGRTGLFYTSLLDRIVFGVSDLIIVHTRESKQLMQTVYGVPESKLGMVPHGSFQTPTFLNKEECKRKLGLQGKTVVTILGFVTSKKGHDLVIPLLPQLTRDVQLVVAGGPQKYQDELYLAKLKELAEQYHCGDRVTFTGYLPDFTGVLNATDIALLPYKYVTDSGVLHLLVAYGIPTIASDLGAFREVYDEYGCLMLFKCGDSQDLNTKIQELLSNPNRRESLKAKCLEMWNVTKWSSIAQKHIQLYRKVLSKTN
jgi:glycosyltransferase involved in cell wall biosynthesis